LQSVIIDMEIFFVVDVEQGFKIDTAGQMNSCVMCGFAAIDGDKAALTYAIVDIT